MKESKQDRLLRFMRKFRMIPTSRVIQWGQDNYYNRAERAARQLAEDGHIRRVTTEELLKRFKRVPRESFWTCLKSVKNS